MIVRAAPERPVIFALALLDWQIVDARDAKAHQPLIVKLPILIAVAAEPTATVIMPFICEPHRDAVLPESPDFPDEPVIQLAGPFAREESFDRFAAMDELRTVPPTAVRRVSERDARWVARVPGVL